MLTDATAVHSIFSFMDVFSGYKYIMMDPFDVEKADF